MHIGNHQLNFFPKQTHMKNVLLVLPILFCLSATASYAQKDMPLNTQEKVKEVRTLSSFEKVAVSGGGNFRFHYAPVPSIELRGIGSCIESVETEVRGKTLYIRSERDIGGACHTEIFIGASSLSEIRLKGGGRVKVEDGFPVVDRFHCHLQGGGEVLMYSLAVDSLFATIQGGGVIKARVKSLLQGEIGGGGVIRYLGTPVVESEISGGGVIKKGK